MFFVVESGTDRNSTKHKLSVFLLKELIYMYVVIESFNKMEAKRKFKYLGK